MSKQNTIDNPKEIRFRDIIGMGLDFSSMIRLFEKGSEDVLWERVVCVTAPKFFNAKSKEEFGQIHQEFCDWGTRNIILAEKKRNGHVIKKRKPASYGQIAKTLDVTLKAAIYYSHLPDYREHERLLKWLHAGVDTRMMAMLRRKYPDYIKPWPTTIEDVDKTKYFAIQEIVSRFINEVHSGKLLPVEFDDMYWYKLNP